MRLQEKKIRKGWAIEGGAAHVAALSPPPFEGSHKAAPLQTLDNGATN